MATDHVGGLVDLAGPSLGWLPGPALCVCCWLEGSGH